MTPPSTGRGICVLLGASNGVLGLPIALEIILRRTPSSWPLLAGIGHGRSYGLTTRILGRELPSLRDCGLWSALDRQLDDDSGPVVALVSDVGNDLGYGVPADILLEWIEDVLDRLQDREAGVTLVGIPVESLDARTNLELAFFRRVLFPSSDLSVARIRQGVEQLAEGLPRLAERRRCRFVMPDSDWYGVDPIHIRRRRRQEAWSTLLESWGEPEDRPGLSCRDHWTCRTWAPERRRWLGRQTGRPQPVAVLRGRPISLF